MGAAIDLVEYPAMNNPTEDPFATREPSPETVDHRGDEDPNVTQDHSPANAAEDPNATRFPEASGSAGSDPAMGSLLTRFRIIRPHAKGGLGEVFVAHDKELNREVALKEIQNRHADHPLSRSRFMLEAEVTGGLEHPGIVPIYGLGQYLDGRPYYAMRFIRGDSLQEAIARYHDPKANQDPGARALELRKLLDRFVDVCNAIAYAHSRQVVHRDIKPGNVMLGPFGETLVVDWGLAKPLGETEEILESGQGPLRLSSQSSQDLTQVGAAVGTPQYMSPEQARGDLDQIGPASDVYSVGATLYTLLTGKVASQAANVAMVLHGVIQGNFPTPRQVKPDVSRPLEAICLKAMALRPEDRYPSARDLADELEHWMADEPVAAYPEPLPARVARWTRRHKTMVAGAAALLLTAAITSTVAFVLVRKERDQKEKLFARAQQSVKDYLVTITESPDLKDDSLIPVRNVLLAKARDYYEQFLAENRDNPKLRKESAEAYFSLGSLYYNISRYDDALKSHRRALELQKERVASQPNDPAVLHDVAMSQDAVANQERRLSVADRAENAIKAYREAVTFLQRAIAAAPAKASAEYEAALAGVFHRLGTLLIEIGRRDEAFEKIQEAINLQRKIETEISSRSSRRDLAVYLHDLCEWHRKAGHSAEAMQLTREVQVERERNATLDPQDAGAAVDLARADFNLAVLLVENKKLDEGSEWCKKARDLVEPLARKYPLRVEYQTLLADILNSSGLAKLAGIDVALSKKQMDRMPILANEAIARFEQHGAIARTLASQYPAVSKYRSDVARSERNIGFTRYVLGQNDEALKLTQSACDRLLSLVRDTPDQVEFRSDLGAALNNLGLILVKMSKRPEAVDVYREAIQNQGKAYALAPGYRPMLFQTYANLAQVELELGHVDAAITALSECRKLSVGLPRESVGVAIAIANCMPADKPDEPAEIAQKRQQIGDLAMAALRQGVDAGFNEVGLLKSIPVLKRLQKRDDFVRLILDVETRNSTNKPGTKSP